MEKANFVAKFEKSKPTTEKAIRESFAVIETELKQSVGTLRTAGQKVALTIDAIVVELNRERDDWLRDQKAVFDSAIRELTQKLGELNAQD